MSHSFKIFSIGMALFLSFSASGFAQHGQFPYANQVGNPAAAYGDFEQSYQYGQPDSYGSYQNVTSQDAVDELYRSNSELPLGGLFAKGFTRTLTLLGGANVLDSIGDEEASLGSIPGLGDLSDVSIESETGYALSFAFGRRHNHRLRSEIELALRVNDTSFDFGQSAIGDLLGASPTLETEQDKIRAYSIMKNFIYGFDNTSRFTPYVGAGLGWSYIELEAPSTGIDDGIGAFTYQAIGGLATSLNNSAEFIVEYRFLGTVEVEVAGIQNPFSYDANNLFLGIKFEY